MTALRAGNQCHDTTLWSPSIIDHATDDHLKSIAVSQRDRYNGPT